MYPRQFKMVCLLLALWFVFVPIGQAMAQSLGAAAAGAVTLPIAGIVVNTSTGATTGQFNGTFTINSFANTPAGQIVAVGMIRGTITNPAGQVLATGLNSISLPAILSQVTSLVSTPALGGPRVRHASFTPAGAGRAAPAQAMGCGALQVAIGAASAVNIMGFSVNLSPATVALVGNTGPVGGLVCQVLGMLGGLLDITPTLNSLLGTLTGLLGGATG